MVVADKDIKIVWEIGGDDSTAFIKIKLMDGEEQITLLEFADITYDLNCFQDINDTLGLYDSIEELKKDIVDSYLQKFLKKEYKNNKLSIITNVRMRLNHQNGLCEGKCIYCNPELGDDTSFDFTFDLKNLDIKGRA